MRADRNSLNAATCQLAIRAHIADNSSTALTIAGERTPSMPVLATAGCTGLRLAAAPAMCCAIEAAPLGGLCTSAAVRCFLEGGGDASGVTAAVRLAFLSARGCLPGPTGSGRLIRPQIS